MSRLTNKIKQLKEDNTVTVHEKNRKLTEVEDSKEKWHSNYRKRKWELNQVKRSLEEECKQEDAEPLAEEGEDGEDGEDEEEEDIVHEIVQEERNIQDARAVFKPHDAERPLGREAVRSRHRRMAERVDEALRDGLPLQGDGLEHTPNTTRVRSSHTAAHTS